MADDKDGVVAQGPAHPYTSIRDAHDAEQHRSLRHDPSNEDAQADIANDESFPASDPPSHASANHLEPAPSSGYDAEAENRIRVRREQHALSEDTVVHLSGIEASGGKKLGTMRYVLAVSLGAVACLFAILLALYR